MTETVPRNGVIFGFCSVGLEAWHTVALHAVAGSLAQGARCLIVDWCFAEPGLGMQLSSAGPDRTGVADWLNELHSGSTARHWKDYIWKDCFVSSPSVAARCDVFPAGGREHRERLQHLDRLAVESLFLDRGLGLALESMREEWMAEYDVVLVCADTGWMRGIGAIHLPDILVTVWPGSDVQQAAALMDRVVREHADLPFDRRRLIIVPVLLGDGWSGEPELLSEIDGEMDRFLSDWVPKGTTASELMLRYAIPTPGPVWGAALAEVLATFVTIQREPEPRLIRRAPGSLPTSFEKVRIYLDGEMAPEDEAQFRTLLSGSPALVAWIESYRATPGLMKKALAVRMPEELSEKLKEFLRSRAGLKPRE